MSRRDTWRLLADALDLLDPGVYPTQLIALITGPGVDANLVDWLLTEALAINPTQGLLLCRNRVTAAGRGQYRIEALLEADRATWATPGTEPEIGQHVLIESPYGPARLTHLRGHDADDGTPPTSDGPKPGSVDA